MKACGCIAITREYLEDDGDGVFSPDMWEICDKEEDCYGPFMQLTEDGREFVDAWCLDASLGYDLCYGRAKGLAAKYSISDVWKEIEDTPDFRIGDVPQW